MGSVVTTVVSMAAAEDLLREVLTRKSNENRWFRGSGHEKSMIFEGFSLRKVSQKCPSDVGIIYNISDQKK